MRRARRWSVSWLVVVVAGCYSPSYTNGGLQCSSSGQCPEGHHCASDNSCWQNGSDPDGGGGIDDLAGGVADMTVVMGCGDFIKNGGETDIDCGGGTCLTCANTKKCLVDGDCTSGFCTATKVCAKRPSLGFAGAIGYTSGVGPNGVAIGSFQTPSKGPVDVAVTNASDGTLTIFFGDGAGGLTLEATKSVSIAPHGVAVGNFHTGGANQQDIAVADGRFSMLVFSNGGLNTFGAGTAYAAAQMNPVGIAVGDLTGDGHPEVIISDRGGTATVGVFVGNNQGTFPTAVQNFLPGNGPDSVAVGDFDRDGKLDVVVAASGDNQINFFKGLGTGSLAGRTNFNTGASPEAIAVGDLDGDGKLDVVTANNGGNASVLLGNGNGTFGMAKGWPAGSQPSGVVIADFDGDGRLDLAVSNLGGNVSILLGDGTGVFAAPKNFAAGTNPWAIATSDLNADGKPDLVVANNGGGDVSVLMNTSN